MSLQNATIFSSHNMNFVIYGSFFQLLLAVNCRMTYNKMEWNQKKVAVA
jgi:hypothetical protein